MTKSQKKAFTGIYYKIQDRLGKIKEIQEFNLWILLILSKQALERLLLFDTRVLVKKFLFYFIIFFRYTEENRRRC